MDLFKEKLSELEADKHRDQLLEKRHRDRGKTKKRLSPKDYEDSLNSFTDGELGWKFFFTRQTMICPAFRALSGNAVKILMAMWSQTKFESSGKDKRISGRLRVAELKPKNFFCPFNFLRCFGLSNSQTIKRGIRELELLGFVIVVKKGNYNSPSEFKHSTRYLKLTSEQVRNIKNKLKELNSRVENQPPKLNSRVENRPPKLK
jgi:hypothetical protein